MPKMRVRAKGAARSSARVVRNKFRIGNRSGGKSALLMSNAELMEVIDNPRKSKFHPNAHKVLEQRGALSV